MKKLLLQIVFLAFGQAWAQQVPPDSVVLKCIFGRLEKDKASASRMMLNASDELERFTFKIVYKKKVRLGGDEFLFVVTEAPGRYLHGHQLGYTANYFLRTGRERWLVTDSIISDGELPLGDDTEYDIVQIGKNKMALLSTFQSTGNEHFEKTLAINLLEKGRITRLFSIDSEYDNAMWKMDEKNATKCTASKFSNTFEVIQSDKEWYDIKSHRIKYGFKKDCSESFVETESDTYYVHQNGRYAAKKQ